MKQAQHWMLMKRKQFLMKSNNFQEWNNKLSNDSWEEKAFEQDASGHLSGCTWPPRSYSCSFCKREFKSAQALGGHMNVHRRDRARLKQSISPQNDVFQCQNHPKPFDSHFPSVVCSFDYDLDHPNSGSNIVASTPTSCRVSALSTPENLSDYTLVSSSPPSTIIQEKNKVSSHHIYDLSGSDSLAVKNQSKEDFTSLTDDSFVETDLLTRFNSTVASQNPLTGFHGNMISCKRPKTAVSGLSLIKPCLGDRCSLQPEVIEPNSSSMEDIDLELRLGEPPKVK